LILRRIIETVASRCHTLRLKCTKFDFGLGSASNPAGGAYHAPPYPLAGFKGPTFKWREGKGKRRGKRKWKGEEREGREGKSG